MMVNMYQREVMVRQRNSYLSTATNASQLSLLSSSRNSRDPSPTTPFPETVKSSLDLKNRNTTIVRMKTSEALSMI